jgi:hypothetical protein
VASAGGWRNKEIVMEAPLTRRVFIQASTASSLGLVAGCGMILHPERRNQPPGGDMDWGIFALDAVGLLLFFIPGVIAFAVDFSTGAIYLPPPNIGYGKNEPKSRSSQFMTVQVPQKELTRERLEQEASRHMGRAVWLVAGGYQTAPLSKIDEFWTTRERLAKSRALG